MGPGWGPARHGLWEQLRAVLGLSCGHGRDPASLTSRLLPAGTHRAWWAWPPAASRLPSKALSPAPCPCPTACPPCPTHPTPLLPAKPSSPRQIETTRVTSCSPGGARRPRRAGGRPAPPDRRVQRRRLWVATALQRLSRCRAGGRWRRPPHVSCSCPVPRASRCPVSFASSLSRVSS